jgi:2-polyprenyl-3-methyl-5-hydroxy-6-metoxy-1,4-benzoquinol methylase
VCVRELSFSGLTEASYRRRLYWLVVAAVCERGFSDPSVNGHLLSASQSARLALLSTHLILQEHRTLSHDMLMSSLLQSRVQSEQLFHDEQASQRASTFRADPHRLRFADEAYLDHETWIRPAMRQLGDLQGKRVLDYGCGHGMASVVLARAGAKVTGFDVSSGYVSEAAQRASANGVSVDFLTADGHQLPFAAESFDAVWGHAILHHLELGRAARELHRILKPGGVAVFCEPWGGNPLLHFARNWLPYPGKHRTIDEQPLRREDLTPLRQVFPDMEVEGHQLFGMLKRFWPANPLNPLLHKLDAKLLQRNSFAHFWCRYVVLTFRKC